MEIMTTPVDFVSKILDLYPNLSKTWLETYIDCLDTSHMDFEKTFENVFRNWADTEKAPPPVFINRHSVNKYKLEGERKW